jgi:hypothetical protein
MMSYKRREAILSSLRDGNLIIRFWSGPNIGGYLRHSLKGVKCLKESEVEALRKSGVIELDLEARPTLGFSPLRLRDLTAKKG